MGGLFEMVVAPSMMAQGEALGKLLAAEAVHVQCLRHETGTRPKEAAGEGGNADAIVAQ